MRRGRKILAVVLVLCMVTGLCVCPGRKESVQAAVFGDYEYMDLAGGNVSITKYKGSAQVLTVPETMDGKRVTDIGDSAFARSSSLTEINLPSGVTSIGSSAFESCFNLAKINFPTGLSSIGEFAFQTCSSLTEISLPTGVTSIGKSAFQSCGSLKKISLPDGLTSIGDWTFEQCSSLTEVILPAGLTSIGEGAFSSCGALTEISLTDQVTSIGPSAFDSCGNLAKISLPVALTSIGDSAFKACTGLTDVNYAGTQQQWDQIQIGSADNGYLKNAAIHFNSGVNDPKNLYDYQEKNGTIEITKYKGTDTEATVPETIDNKAVTSIGNEAFFSCQNLTKITLPTGITSIEDGAFRSCTGLTQINLPTGLLNLGDGAFKDCTGLTQMDLPAGLTNMGFSVFRGCTSLAQISLPTSISSIKDGAFADCIGLKKISIPTGVTSIEDGAFTGCSSLSEINLPVGLNSIGDAAFQNCAGLTDVYYDGSSIQWNQIQIGLNNADLQNAAMHFKISSGGDNGIYEYTQKSDGTIEITKYKGTDTEVKVPENIDGKAVTSIGDSAFADCKDVTKIIIPNEVTSIGSHAFNNCALVTEIDIPGSVTYIDNYAFMNCSGLKDVYYAGTEQQWNTIDIVATGNDYLLNAQKHFQKDTVDDTEQQYEYKILDDGTIEIVEYKKNAGSVVSIPAMIDGRQVTSIGEKAFYSSGGMVIEISIPEGVKHIGNEAFSFCGGLTKISIPDSVTSIGEGVFNACGQLTEIIIPENLNSIEKQLFQRCRKLENITIPLSVTNIGENAFKDCIGLKDVYYSGTEEQWKAIQIHANGNEQLLNATIHFKEAPKPQPPQEEEPLPNTVDAKEELQRLKVGDPFLLNQDFQHYLSDEQIDVIESYLFTWLAEVNYVYQYSGSASVKELIMKKAGIDPHGDFASGREQAVMHMCVDTKYGPRIFAVTLDLGKPDDSGNLYPTYGAMHYEVLEKGSLPSDLPKSGQIGRESYTDLGTFVQCVSKASEDSLHGTYQWETLSDEMTSGVLVDKTVTEIIGNKNGSFSDAVLTVYAQPLFTYSKKVTIACPVDVHIYSMDGKEAGSIVNNKPSGGSGNVRLDVNGDTKTAYLTGNDYYLNLRGTGTGTMRYEVEEIANEEVRRNVQFLELQLKEDMQYEGYVFRPLNIDRDLYALRTKDGSGQEVFYPDSDTYKALFRRIQGLSLSQGQTSLDRDKTLQLSASMIPLDASNPNLQWTTDSESVVKVDSNGLVTAVGSGRATVTVSTKDGSFLKQYCVIDVAELKKEDGPSGGGGSSGSSSSGWSGGSAQPPVEQEKNPVVVNLHYVLQFQTNGGTNLSRKTMTLLADDSPGIMPKVQRKDYLFDGWYTKQDGGEKITGDKPLKEAATLYAKWTRVTAPAKSAVASLKSKKKGQMQVGFQNINGVSGYQIEYALNKKFTSSKTKEAGKTAKSKTLSGLKAGKKYYVRVRAYQLDSMKNRIYGAYSTVKSVKVKS